jgi:DUF1365 family protein
MLGCFLGSLLATSLLKPTQLLQTRTPEPIFQSLTAGIRFMRSQRPEADRTVVRIDHSDTQGLLISTSVSGQLQPLTAASLRRALWSHPLHSLGVIARIHWQALQLWLKRVPLVDKPSPPDLFATRGGD